LQETFVRVVTHSWRFCADYAFCTWLYKIATNLAANELRKKKRRMRETFVEEYPPLPAPGDDPSEVMSRAETAALLTRCLGQLDDAHRTVFLLRVSEGMPYEEIARILDCPVATARTRMFYAITKLRQEMGLTKQERS
jgi:RNA polymerase sigma-70 factor (ECF subfamily)